MREVVVTITDRRLNGGGATNLVMPGPRPSRAEFEAVIENAARLIAAGSRAFPAYRSIEEAAAAAQSGHHAPTAGDDDRAAGRYDYWGGGVGKKLNQVLRGLPAAPDDSYYRLVDSDEEAAAALEAGERPLHGHPDLSEETFSRLQQLQYELPGRLYGVDAAERTVEIPAPVPGRQGSIHFALQSADPNYDQEFDPKRRLYDYLNNADEVRQLLGIPAPLRPRFPGIPPMLGGPQPRGSEAGAADRQVPDEAATSFARGASGSIPLRQALPMLMREPMGGAATAPALEAAPGRSLAASYSPSALHAAQSGSIPGARPIVGAPLLGAVRGDVMPRAFKPTSEDVSTSDYLRELPPRDASITQRLDGGGGVVPLRVALPMLLQRAGGQDEADG